MTIAPELNQTSTPSGTGSILKLTEDKILKTFERIHILVDTRSIIFSAHARTRMFERGISSEDILPILSKGEIIESYDDDTPCPSFLMLGYIHDSVLHIVIAVCEDHIKIVTVYHPDTRWINDKMRR